MSYFYQKIFLFSFFLGIAVPIFPTYTGGMMYHALLISLMPLFFIGFVFKTTKEFFCCFFLIFFLFLIASIFSLLNEVDLSLLSLISSFKILYFLFYFMMGYSFSTIANNAIEGFTKVYFLLVIISMIFGVVELINPSISYFLYKRDSIEILDDKLSSIFNTTYHLSFFLFFGFLYFLISYVEKIKGNNFRDKKTSFPLLSCIIIFLFILLTQSRIFVLVSLFMFFLMLSVVFIKKITNIKIFSLIIIITVSFLWILNIYLEEISEKFYYVINGIEFLISGSLDFSGNGIGSFNTRINQIIFSINEIKNNPFIGAGSGKDLYLESLYSYLLYKYAVPGLLLYFICGFFILKIINKNIELSQSELDLVFFKTCYWFFLLSPIYFLSGPLFDVPKLSQFFFCLIGVIYGRYFYKTRYNLVNQSH
ncbi:hypothetical protein PZA22_11085 [Pectobacterium polaris]|uniref:hypothetical protein n=1 Tax=Pectobacterium TaxID=122277 RepID=UPI00057D7573|nr:MULTISPECIES: hypothetical protein [Pectobacterium]KHS85367.1 hypothetical protein RC83_15860 [Pectobacterium brasiliense]MDE8755032.1 hypothetical protein [Pectobacterium polaris]